MKQLMGTMVMLIIACCGVTAQNSRGLLKGRVLNHEGEGLSRAEVTLLETGAKSLSDNQGNFVLFGAPTGDFTVRVTALGFEPLEQKTTIKSGVSEMGDLTLQLAAQEEELRVVGSLLEGQVAAMDRQRLAANIKNIVASDRIGSFPDSNAADATKRIPGIFTQMDQGEGRYVQVRGTEARLNKTTINSQDIPSPEGDLRTVALDVIPIDMLDAIEVSKAVTPDMDGDSVGGTVDLVVKKAPSKRRFAVGAEYGYNDLADDDIVAGDLLFGNRFNEGKFGVLATFSWEDANRATHNFEAEYDDGNVEEFELRDYSVNRKRIGAHLSLDYDPSSQLNFTLNASYAQFDDQEFRRRTRFKVADGEMERELKDRFESQLIDSVQLKSTYYTQAGHILEWSIGHSYARESEPDRLDTTFETEDIVFNPNFSAGNIDPRNIQPNPTNEDINSYVLGDQVGENNYTNDEHNSFKIDYSWPISIGENTAIMKAGFKFRAKEKMRNLDVIEYKSSNDLFLRDYLDGSYSEDNFLDGRYSIGGMVDVGSARNTIRGLADESERDFEEDAGDYEIQEDLTAAYVMSTIEVGEKWTLLPGLRFEQIDADYLGSEVIFDDEGDYQETIRTAGDKKDDLLMPMFHSTYKFDERTQLRSAITHTYARARVYDQVPYRLLLEEDREIEEGNPNLEITTVWNFDVMYEKYYENAGLFSLGFFYKDLTDYIYIFNADRLIGDEEYEVTTPLNGESATLWGLEFAFNKTFESGFGMYFNYTYTDSDAKLEDRDITLPGQTEEIGNLALTYEKNGFSTRLSGNLHGEYIFEVGGDETEDIWQDGHLQWDLTVSYQVRDYRFFLELVNLNDEEFVFYEGSPTFPIQFEQYKTWGRLGFKWNY